MTTRTLRLQLKMHSHWAYNYNYNYSTLQGLPLQLQLLQLFQLLQLLFCRYITKRTNAVTTTTTSTTTTTTTTVQFQQHQPHYKYNFVTPTTTTPIILHFAEQNCILHFWARWPLQPLQKQKPPSVHQWIPSAIHASQQLTNPIFFYLWSFRHRLVRYYC